MGPNIRALHRTGKGEIKANIDKSVVEKHKPREMMEEPLVLKGVAGINPNEVAVFFGDLLCGKSTQTRLRCFLATFYAEKRQ